MKPHAFQPYSPDFHLHPECELCDRFADDPIHRLDEPPEGFGDLPEPTGEPLMRLPTPPREGTAGGDHTILIDW